ncbi:RND family transporter [Mycobacterium sp. CBMA293]|uniref:MMPL/RND family transporter n=1 Tax=unclassified Mycolicibacterium TaxID=2636767 RepID=UPI0012DBFE09|nr:MULTISPECIES: RND family transporter [unclassified Mycolicibacterium]MUL47850.1 RND family transporter [Mycolicibacterium sp. CBMA 360]MUL59302.1 RND family transporter [Mycolicibacterium sp. CBMA 335]MUL71027.1 RND family transporter [Mycolicibacterium sp. CBMA 311]MUL94670.1 RND family transporter [Mycolicibacterium sp. CBMA 230]MUM09152.1 MMPL family RND transporter [Mycolicibacterium sp. CBMA 213]
MRRLADFVVRWPWAVIGVWIVLAVALPLSVPSLNDMAQKHPLAMLPADAPSAVAAKQMTEAFKEPGGDDLLLVVLINDHGLGKPDEATYRKLVDALRDDPHDVVMLQDFISTPPLRNFLTSEDKKAWVLPVGLTGALGTPQSYEAYNRVAEIVRKNTAGSPLAIHLAGPAATVADLTVAGEKDRMPIEIAIAVLVLLVLLVVYRNPVTMLLPLAGIGMSLVIAQAVVAGLSQLTGLGVSNQAIILLSAMIFGAGTDYAVFLISRYHDYVRQGDESNDAVRRALTSVGKVITASAATVGVTFLAISFSKMGVFSTVGVSSAIGIGVAFLAAVTLLPAILTLVGPRGWIKPKHELTAPLWRRSGARIVRRPRLYLVASLLVLILLASAASFAKFNYDDRKAVAASEPSSVGYAALEKHFNVNQSVPSYVLVRSPHDLRNPQSLADLEQMASRISQLPDIALVSGITRPMGDVPPEFRATFQAGLVGDRLTDGANLIGDRTGDINRLSKGADTLATNLSDVRGQVNQIATSIQSTLDAFTAMRSQYGGDKLVQNVEVAAKLINSVSKLGNTLGLNYTAARDMFAWVGPVLAALQNNVTCDLDVSCAETRGHFQRLEEARQDGTIDEINQLAGQLQSMQDKKTLNATVTQLQGAMTNLNKVMRSLGMDSPAGAQANLTKLRQGADRSATGSREVASGVDEIVDQIKLMRSGLDQAGAFLLSMKHNAAGPAQAGFNIPPEVLQLAAFKSASKMFISPDGHSVRYLVLTKLDPFSAAAMDQVNTIRDTARGAQPNTSLSDATVSMGGYPVALKDTRDYYQNDIRFIIIVTIAVVLLILMVLLRSLVAPLYLVGSVVLSYFAALGIGVVVFQYLFHQPLHWTVPPLAFVVLVAVGADYNMLFVSRMRDESPHGMRYGIIRTLSSTGGVITAAGLIFAASMWGLLFSSIGTVIQGGFVIGAGILLDTFLVRTITVPAMATLVGNANWWPSRPISQGSKA